ncbi:T9SS type A sorting domain-containing protein [bacterium]|nr:MAG: T9SS type A sorting domain-containing protein [bacterium]
MRRIYAIFLISLFAASGLIAAKPAIKVERISDEPAVNTNYNSNELMQSKNSETQRKSYYSIGTAPLPFNAVNNPHTQLAISTGYYVVDFADDAPSYWKPSETLYSLDENPERWVTVVPGPRVLDKSYWDDNKEEGLRFFRNPAYPVQNNGDFFDQTNDYYQDTTDNAFAGPMPLKLVGGFYFNGIRYDSFYVTTNGLIALTNRRYFYDEFGHKYIPAGETSAYDPNSMDYFVGYIGGENRNRSGNGLNDNVTDDFGYNWSIIGGNKADKDGGIRGNPIVRSTPLNQVTSSSYKAALIAFMYGNYELSQYSEDQKKVDHHGKVQYYRTLANDKLVIYYQNLAQAAGNAWGNGYNITGFPGDQRPGENGYVAVSGQTILNRNDSSITIIYERFVGAVRSGYLVIPAKDIFRGSSTVGVYGFARHSNYNVTGGPNENSSSFPWVSEYEQYTHYFDHINQVASFPQTFTSLKFKQHQNTLRVVDIQYRVRKQDPNASLAFSETVNSRDVNNYELLAGDDHLGAMQPVAIIQNVSNDLQSPTGVNFVPQDLNFYARFRVQNKATGRIIYNRGVPVDNKCLSTPDNELEKCEGDPNVRVRLVTVTIDKDGNYQAEVATYPGTNSWNGKTRTGIPPYGYVEVKFPPFEPNEFARDENNKLYQIGRMAAYIIADPTNPNNGKKLGDQWPFDDTASVNLHVMRLHNFFSDDGREYHIIDGSPIPSVQKWVSIDAEMVSGDVVSRHPLAPRGKYAADNNPNYFLSSPVIKMNRVDLNGQDNSPGDELRSHPIDMRGRYGSVISLSVQRTLDVEFWDRGFGDNSLVGPEPRSVINRDVFSVFNTFYSVAANPDMLALEIMQPSDNGVANITNVKDNRWRNHPRRGGADAETKVPALGIYGAGGYVTGFLESDRDSSLAQPNAGTRELNSLRPDIYDDGIDFIYKKYFVPVPDTFIRWQNDGAKHFRFRLKMFASNDKKCDQCTSDDDDNFLVDNINVLFRSTETTDIEVSAVSIDWPYTEAPATQATKIPIEVTASNNTANNAPFYYMKVKIFRGANVDNKNLVYCRTLPITFHEPNEEIVRNFPDFNARDFGEGTYRAQAIVIVEGGDLEELNDTTYTDFKLKFGPTFAYDPVASPKNDIGGGAFPEGRGLNIQGYAYGGRGSANGPSGGYDELQYGSGYVGGSISGQIAMKFELLQADTIYGYDALFGTINQAPDAISLSIYKGNPNLDIPQGEILESRIDRQRGRDDRTDKLNFGEYVRYLLPKGKAQVLKPGTYWVAIAQLGETGLELGGSKQRTGLRTMSVYIPPPIYATSDVGGSGVSLNIHKEFRKRNNSGNLLNNSYFAFENTRGSGNWTAFTPSIGNVGYGHLHHFGVVPSEGRTLTLTNGTWIPLIRPFLGSKASGNAETINDCDIPIELVDFKGDQRKEAIDLYWETATEKNNKGFYIEKRYRVNDEFNAWKQVSFVNGKGNTKTSSYYSFADKDVKTGTTYQYRLRQVDFDGTQTCYDSKIVEVDFIGSGNFAMENYPNPAKDKTTINYSLNNKGFVTLEVLDLLGNVVKTLVNENVDRGLQHVDYNVTDNSGKRLTSGTYIYRLTVDGKSQTAKLNVVQ